MRIRKATVQDLDSIYTLYKEIALDRNKMDDSSYVIRIQKEGFLLGLETKEQLKSLINEANQFLVYEDDGEIYGYIVADHREKYLNDKYKTWFDESEKDIYYSSDHAMTVATLGVRKGSGRKGVGTALSTDLEQILKESGFTHLYSIVTIGPVANFPSLHFHEKIGFRRIAIGSPRRLFDLDNYSGVLLYKEL